MQLYHILTLKFPEEAMQHQEPFSLVYADTELCSPETAWLFISDCSGTSQFAADNRVVHNGCFPPTLQIELGASPLWAENRWAPMHQDCLTESWCLYKRAYYFSKLGSNTEMASGKFSLWLEGCGHLRSVHSRLTLKGQLVLLRGQSNPGLGCI